MATDAIVAASSSRTVICVHYDHNRNPDAEILFARFREEDVLAGKLGSGEPSLKSIVKSKEGMNRGTVENPASAKSNK